MDSAPRGACAIAVLLAALSLPPPRAAAPEGAPVRAPVVVGLDHIPVAVADLDGAAERYRRLGFSLKPGRPHENGIRNRHVKFRDGTEIELITAAGARDSLTAGYLRHLARGDGPAFVALFAPNVDAVAARLHAAGRAFRRDGPGVSFPETDGLRYIFFGGRNLSPTDRPEDFAHQNGADGLIGVWLAGEDLTAERALLELLGASFAVKAVRVPDLLEATVAELPEAEVVLLSGDRRRVPGRRIVGATVRTRDLGALRRVLATGRREGPPPVEANGGRSIFLPPEMASGMWIEFREDR